jgi:uncharacterized protein YdhG (YjbR/CyaY superfamily)
MEAIDHYLSALSPEQRSALHRLRELILGAMPGIEEHFGYGMPGFMYNGHPLLYIGAAKKHCALYGSVPPGFNERLKDFAMSKGAIRFTPERPLPVAVVKAIVKAKCMEVELRWGAGPSTGY